MTQESLLARYKVLNEVGRGATGAVYAARDRTSGAVVALKRLDPALLNDLGPDFIAGFLHHTRSAKGLKHPNIVETYDAGEAGGTPYVAMEMLEGCESLRSILARGPLPVARAIRIANDVASGLAHAHLQGAVHRGLKPSSVTVLPSGIAKIADFGMGQAMPLDAAASCPVYMPPEQLRSDPIIDHRCDLYSLGALLYEMLTGRAPYQGKSAKEVLENIARAAPRRPSELNANVPRVLDGIVSGLLSAQPGGRMAGMPLLVRELQRLEEGLGLNAAPTPKAEEPVRPEPAAPPKPPAPPEPAVRAAPPPVPPGTVEEPQPARRPNNRDFFDHQAAIAIMEREARMRRPSRARPVTLAGVVLALGTLGIVFSDAIKTGLAGYTDEWRERGEQAIAALTEKSPPPAPVAPRPAVPPPVAEPAPAAAPAPVAAPAPAPVTAPAPVATATPVAPPRVFDAPPEPLPAPTPVALAQRTKETKETKKPTAPEPEPQQTGGTAKLVVAVSPRGEIYIDGKHYGTTPPVTTLDLEPGLRRIEIRSGSRKPYLTYMTVQPGDERRIRHDFNARPSRPAPSSQKLVSTKP